ncbi:MAG: hypothetical protein KAI15_00270 [Gammaproteobacteria bacterium]|nr:hypothetical protein [Gammaproteobacteria bacterium]
MPKLRVETATHPDTGKVYAELYYPGDELIPIAVTEPIYLSSEDAVTSAHEMFENWISLITEEFTA